MSLNSRPLEWTLGDGWREVPVDSAPHVDYLYLNEGGRDRWWVRVEPVPPLPTAPYTVIRVTWKPGYATTAEEFVLTSGRRADAVWECIDMIKSCSPKDLIEQITGFEVLASPERWLRDRAIRDEVRRETANAVLERIASEPWAREVDLAKWRTDFGVEA